MEHTRLVARLLSEVASARAAITASYVRLWPSEAEQSAAGGDVEHGAEPRRQNPEDGSIGAEPPSNDVGEP